MMDSLYNWRTGTLDWVNIARDDLSDYLPQNAMALALYNCYLEQGKSKEDAMKLVCSIYRGDRKK